MKLLDMLNKALSMEHSAAIQYRTHAENINGPYSDPIMAHLRELADDEDGHAAKLRTLISDYLQAVPTLETAETKSVWYYSEIIEVNIQTENEAVEVYTDLYNSITGEFKSELQATRIYYTFEHDIRHILMEESEHIAELKRIM